MCWPLEQGVWRFPGSGLREMGLGEALWMWATLWPLLYLHPADSLAIPTP